jgi:hypothetical protein
MATPGRWSWFVVLLLAVLGTDVTLAQTGMPGSDIYLAELEYLDGAIVVGKPGNITRRPGYDNQPSFIAQHVRIFYTSYRDDGQSDIIVYDHETGRTLGFRGTEQSEYSAMLTPDGAHVSVVRVEEDSTQRLWMFPNQEAAPEVLLEDRPGVGYYTWGNDSTVVLFILGSPNEMHIGNVRTGVTEHITDDIGRSLHKIPGRNAISFSQPDADSIWWIKSLDLETREIQPIVATVPESQDYAWTPGGMILMAKDSLLYQCNPKVSTEWQQIADLSQHSIKGITRLAVSADGWYLALVAEE